MTQSRAPLHLAIGLLLLPMLYAGAYLTLVDPPGVWVQHGFCLTEHRWYRMGGENAKIAFWPLEQIDRKLRPDAWQRPRVERILQATSD